MLKRMTLLARRLDRSFEDFSSHWIGTHGEIVKRMPAVHRYIQNPVSQRLLTGLNAEDPFSFDGFVELWFASSEAQATAFASAAAKELPVDEMNFIRGITIFPVTEDRRQQDSGSVKAMVTARIAGDGVEAATTALADELGALPGARVVAINQLGAAGWRDHLWHEPKPPNAIIELGLASEASASALPAAMQTIHGRITSAGGVLECYLVQPRRVI